MGALSAIDLAAIIASHKLRYLVEFGTGEGEDAAHAAGFPFEHIYSIDPSHRLAIQAAFRHAANQRMTFIHGKGERGWRQAAPEIPAEAPVLFLLEEARLAEDFAAIAKGRDLRRDVFLVEGQDAAALTALAGPSHRVSAPAEGLLCAAPEA